MVETLNQTYLALGSGASNRKRMLKVVGGRRPGRGWVFIWPKQYSNKRLLVDFEVPKPHLI